MKREQQVNFFKHRSKANEEDVPQEMADLNILAEYEISNGASGADSLYIVQDEDNVTIFLSRGPEESKEVILLDPDDVDEGGEFSDYNVFLEAIQEETAQDHSPDLETFELAEAKLRDGTVVDAHTHIATVDENGDGITSEEMGHTHKVFSGYIAPSFLAIGDKTIPHIHLRKCEPDSTQKE